MPLPISLYLASTSPARLTILRAAGVEPIVVPSGVDEHAVAAAAERAGQLLDGSTLVMLLARAKAEAVGGSDPAGLGGATLGAETLSAETLGSGDSGIDGLILGVDSAFEFDGRLYGKPHRPEIARQRWIAQSGRSGILHSGHWLIDHRGGSPRAAVGGVSSASVTFADVSAEEIDAYIATGEPLEVAGAFTIDSLGGAFVSRIEGDPHTVVGVSVSLVRMLAGQFGVAWPDVWNRRAL